MFLAGENEIVAHRELRKHLQQLKSAADAEPVDIAGSHAGRLLAVDPHLALVRRQLAEHAVEQCRFARAVRPDDAEDFAFLHVEGDAVDRGDAAESFAQVGDFEHRGHGLVLSGCNAGSGGTRLKLTALMMRSSKPRMPVGQKAIISMTSTA